MNPEHITILSLDRDGVPIERDAEWEHLGDGGRKRPVHEGCE